jgi:mono/diheme cytochrome c family protein
MEFRATGPARRPRCSIPIRATFRNGVFKYTSTAGGAKPLPDDLLRTVQQGIPGTAMPSFGRLPAEQLAALLEYVKYLAMRGETELYLLQTVVDEDASLPLNMDDILEEGVRPAAKAWDAALALAVVPSPPPAKTPAELALSIARGQRVFAGAGQCVRCHGQRGDGHGEQAELYDDWNKRKVAAPPGRFRLPRERLRPRDFTRGVFHGGDRPVDQYWRVYVGIKGTPMPPHGPAPGSNGVLTPAEIWDVVNYARSLGTKDARNE